MNHPSHNQWFTIYEDEDSKANIYSRELYGQGVFSRNYVSKILENYNLNTQEWHIEVFLQIPVG